MLERRLPCFHLLACLRACGAWLPRWRREDRNVRACEWCLDCLCRLAPCSSTERSAGNPCRLLWDEMVPQRLVLVLPIPSGQAGHLHLASIRRLLTGAGGQRSTRRVPPSLHRSRGPRGSATLLDPAHAADGDSGPSPKRSFDITCDGRSRPLAAPAVQGRRATSWRIATWLILPVVICLSQRLSHACVSMN